MPRRRDRDVVARMTFLTIDHVQLAMPPGGEAEAAAFYEDVLGMEQVPKPEPMRSGGGAWFRFGAVELHLGIEEDFRPARKAHPALRVDDIDEVALRCGRAGLGVVWDDRYPGVRRFYVDDPFGNRIEILQRLDDSPLLTIRSAMTDKVDLLRHFLATLAYRTQKSLHDAPAGFEDFSAGSGARTPLEILNHMSNVLAFSAAAMQGLPPAPTDPPAGLAEGIALFHSTLERLAAELSRASFHEDRLAERLLQGPLADAMTHAGQLAFLRRLAGVPVAGENFFRAPIDSGNLGPDQPFPTTR